LLRKISRCFTSTEACDLFHCRACTICALISTIIDIFYLVTDQGWRITKEWGANGAQIVASRGGVQKTWPSVELCGSVFDRFAAAIDTDAALPEDIISVEMAAEDIHFLRALEQQ